jgi:hypothetical protein
MAKFMSAFANFTTLRPFQSETKFEFKQFEIENLAQPKQVRARSTEYEGREMYLHFTFKEK